MACDSQEHLAGLGADGSLLCLRIQLCAAKMHIQLKSSADPGLCYGSNGQPADCLKQHESHWIWAVVCSKLRHWGQLPSTSQTQHRRKCRYHAHNVTVEEKCTLLRCNKNHEPLQQNLGCGSIQFSYPHFHYPQSSFTAPFLCVTVDSPCYWVS